jgi:hypothetical protein
MSRENVEVAERFIEAWNARDADGLAEVTHPEGEILLPRNLLEGGSYVGPDGARRALADALETWEEAHVVLWFKSSRPDSSRSRTSVRIPCSGMGFLWV